MSNVLLQKSHVLPVHWLRHPHVQPVSVLPVTVSAWLEQFASLVQIRKHSGYCSRVATHVLQFVAASYCGLQVHWQFGDVPLTLTALLLQSSTFVHTSHSRRWRSGSGRTRCKSHPSTRCGTDRGTP
jgi:hypothetical protein